MIFSILDKLLHYDNEKCLNRAGLKMTVQCRQARFQLIKLIFLYEGHTNAHPFLGRACGA